MYWNVSFPELAYFIIKTSNEIFEQMLKVVKPDAVFCLNDEMAIGAFKALKELNIDAPKDITIKGFDDIQLESYVQPSLSTRSHPKFDYDTVTAECVFAGLGDNNTAVNMVLPTELIVRNSTNKK